jgi:hypothetical protein
MKQEPVARIVEDCDIEWTRVHNLPVGTLLYTAPREPLNAERLYYLHESFYGIDETGQWNLDYIAFARAIEKEHGII